ncbi:MAG: hypothetical protein RSB95_04920, partial [Bacilli bacterium]
MKNRAQDLSEIFSTFVENYRDEFVLDYLNINNTNIQGNNVIVGDSKSFSFFDRETNKNYLITSKDNTPKDKLVISSGIAPGSSKKFDYYVNTINELSLLNNDYIDRDFNELVYDFSKLLIKLEKPIKGNEINDLENIDFDYLQIEYDKNKPS